MTRAALLPARLDPIELQPMDEKPPNSIKPEIQKLLDSYQPRPVSELDHILSPASRALLIRDVIPGLRSLHSLTQGNIPTPLRDWLTRTSMLTLCWLCVIDVMQRRTLHETSTLYSCPHP
jgi:hypothetical protein